MNLSKPLFRILHEDSTESLFTDKLMGSHTLVKYRINNPEPNGDMLFALTLIYTLSLNDIVIYKLEGQHLFIIQPLKEESDEQLLRKHIIMCLNEFRNYFRQKTNTALYLDSLPEIEKNKLDFLIQDTIKNIYT